MKSCCPHPLPENQLLFSQAPPTPESLEKKGKTLKQQGNLCRTKKQGNQKSKERKDRVRPVITKPASRIFEISDLKQKAANCVLRRNSLANANGFANAIAKISSSVRRFLSNGGLRRHSIATANAMAWCTQPLTKWRKQLVKT